MSKRFIVVWFSCQRHSSVVAMTALRIEDMTGVVEKYLKNLKSSLAVERERNGSSSEKLVPWSKGTARSSPNTPRSPE